MGKWLIMIGIACIVVGGILYWGGNWIRLGNLPGDFHWTNGRSSVHLPIVSSLVVSIILTILLNLFLRR